MNKNSIKNNSHKKVIDNLKITCYYIEVVTNRYSVLRPLKTKQSKMKQMWGWLSSAKSTVTKLVNNYSLAIQ
jgi:hypothetical protein